MPEALSANCGNHATASAVATCRRCGLFLCDACMSLEDDESYCSTCVALRREPPSKLARASVFLPLASVACAALMLTGTSLGMLSIFGLPAWLGGVAAVAVERGRLRAKPDSIRGQLWVRAGIWTSVTAAVLGALPTGAVLVFVLWEFVGHRH
jgi:hypothetical protein